MQMMSKPFTVEALGGKFANFSKTDPHGLTASDVRRPLAIDAIDKDVEVPPNSNFVAFGTIAKSEASTT